MKASERRQAILEALCERRKDKIENLAFEFNVTERTIRNDIQELSLSYPIYTVQGKYDGGVYIDNDYYLGKRFLTPEQQDLLLSLARSSDQKQNDILLSIIKKFGKNTGDKK